MLSPLFHHMTKFITHVSLTKYYKLTSINLLGSASTSTINTNVSLKIGLVCDVFIVSCRNSLDVQNKTGDLNAPQRNEGRGDNVEAD